MIAAALPGPWKPCTCGKCGLVWSIPADYCVADVCGGEGDEQGALPAETREANRRLICAAPDLLEMLKAIVDPESGCRLTELALKNARAEIAKAVLP